MREIEQDLKVPISPNIPPSLRPYCYAAVNKKKKIVIVTRPKENEKKEGSYAAILCTMPNCKLRYLPKNMS